MQRVPEGFWERVLPLLQSATQEEIARRVGVRQPSVGRWLKRERVPDLLSLAAISRAFGISADELLGLASPTSVAPQVGERDSPKVPMEQVRDALLQLVGRFGRDPLEPSDRARLERLEAEVRVLQEERRREAVR